jgi:thioredoxin:protein disulfide reductase
MNPNPNKNLNSSDSIYRSCLVGFRWLALTALLPVVVHATDLPTRSPFGIAVTPINAGGSNVLRVDFTVPKECVINVDRLHFRTADGNDIHPVQIPEPELEVNQVTGKTNPVYPRDFSAVLNPADLPNHQLAVKFQGCTNGQCYFPEQRLFGPQADGSYAEVTASDATVAPVAGSTSGATDWAKAFEGFTVKGQQTGFLGKSEFISFLDRALAGQESADPLDKFKKMGLAATLLLIVAGGFLLNFTPCILPMIPINLTIIGAGRAAKSRMDGFRNGSIYGLGIALAYGTLGLVVVLTGSKFGTLNSNMWFNLFIALVFVVMALGMFDLIAIDLSRFSGSGPSGSADRGALAQQAVVFSMGVMSALLAGACVAPVVISVVLLATNLYAKGTVAGLLLPFLLGVGMALPWPFAGAGLTFLPKPGAWMKYVKYGFGIMIIGFALYYGKLAWHAHQAVSAPVVAAGASSAAPAETGADLLAAIQKSRATGQPLFVDFHASWCKDCSAMDELVFNQPEVRQHLEKFVAVRYAAEQPNVAPVKPLLDHFNIVGLPTYMVLSPK